MLNGFMKASKIQRSMMALGYAFVFSIILPILAMAVEEQSPVAAGGADLSGLISCAQLSQGGDVGASGGGISEERLLLCQLYESSALLAQLGALVNEGIDRLASSQGLVASPASPAAEARDKRKHEYLRFGKRKHEYLRFGKRKHEYLRFGKK